MTGTTVKAVDTGQADDMAPPPGTAIVRPLRHVRAVRERYLQRFTDPAEAAASRSARAWAWALGETATAPVTDRETAVPPSRSEIEAEIGDGRREALARRPGEPRRCRRDHPALAHRRRRPRPGARRRIWANWSAASATSSARGSR